MYTESLEQLNWERFTEGRGELHWNFKLVFYFTQSLTFCHHDIEKELPDIHITVCELCEQLAKQTRGQNQTKQPPKAKYTSLLQCIDIAWDNVAHSCLSIYVEDIAKKCAYLQQSLQLVELAVQLFKVVFVKSPEAILVHDLHQHTEGLLLWHLRRKEVEIVTQEILYSFIYVHVCTHTISFIWWYYTTKFG